MKAIAVITARGGSKRIPDKNIKEFCGKPVIAYSIEAACSSGCFDEVMVSTDSSRIADTARSFGASVPFFRSAAASSDTAVTEDAVTEVLDRYQEMGMQYDMVCCIYPAAPFVSKEKLCQAFELLAAHPQAESVIPVVKFSFPPQRALIIRSGAVCYQYPEYAAARSQDLEPVYHDCGQFYLCRTQALYKYHDLITPNSIPVIMKEEEVQDIDTLSDWNLAELKYKRMAENREGKAYVPAV